MKQINFITGLPRSGSTLITYLLRQNPDIHGEPISSLSSLVGSIHSNWHSIDANKEYDNVNAKIGLIQGMLQGYYSHIKKSIVFDKDRNWIQLIGLLEAVTQKEVKMVVCVRNPAEILSSFEKLRRENPLYYTLVDQDLRESSSIAGRAMYYAGPNGPLGLSHRHLLDAITMGYLNRLLFVDYNRFCNSPRTQMKRIYDFFSLPNFEHNFDQIEQQEIFNNSLTPLPKLHTIKNKLEKTTINPVAYLGFELHEMYNKEIFWNAWI